MNSIEHTSSDQLRQILQAIINEEQTFKETLTGMKCDNLQLEQAHALEKDVLDKHEGHARLRRVHEALFKVHRKIKHEHEMVVQRCYFLSERLAAGFFNDREISTEINRLKILLDKIKAEHELLQVERKKIISEHNSLIGTDNDDLKRK